ncbi:DUF4190 domain-containing protein [Streptomyces sp. PTD5-9]|uniref:DUF4190 domain-containing protein n=1 Tax=Streptomyces sp. PTD5-9 TaxID=3120150 RepID=UPI003009CD3B
MALTASVRRRPAVKTDPRTRSTASAAPEAGAGSGPETEARPGAPGDPRTEAASDSASASESGPASASDECGRGGRDADGLAVASFVLGLIGLLVMNVLLGPAAIVMAVLALVRSTSRPGRALLGLALGIADLVVLAVLVTGSGTVSWNFSG